MRDIKHFYKRKLSFFHISVQLEYYGTKKKNRYRNLTAFLVKKWKLWLVFSIYLLEYYNGWKIPIKFKYYENVKKK